MKRKYIAMIPARLESKRIPKKNIRYMGDKPLIQYPVDLAKESGLFDSVWINTESKELGRVAESLGVLFHDRPTELAKDGMTNREFTYEFLKRHVCDYVIMLNTTSPLLRLDTLKRFVEYVDLNDYDTVLSVVSEKEESFYNGEPLNFSLDKKTDSQFLQPIEHICWAITAWKRDTFINLQDQGENPVYGGKLGRFTIPKDESCDLDTIEDWNIAEGILLSRQNSMTERYMNI